MATSTISETRHQTEADGDQLVALHDVAWEDYETILGIRGERRFPRMIYLDGSLFLMSPSRFHERFVFRFARLMAVLTEELDIPCVEWGGATYRRLSKEGGVEPDQSYYFVDEEPARGKPDLDLDVDPPPDLVIEVVWTHKADASLEVHRRLGVREVWVWEEGRLQMLHLDRNGEYVPAERSLAFPALKANEVESWIPKDMEKGNTAWAKDFRAWVRRVLLPRHREKGADASDRD